MAKKFTRKNVKLIALFSFWFYSFNAVSQTSTQLLKDYATAHQQQLGISASDVESVALTYEYTDPGSGIKHIYSNQKLNGLTVTESNFSLHISGATQTETNKLIALGKYKIVPVNAGFSAQNAVLKVMSAINYPGDKNLAIKQAASGSDSYTIFKRNSSKIWDVPVRLVYFNNLRLKTLVPAWEVQMMDVSKKHYWLAYVDAATGIVLQKKDLIIHCTFDGAPTDEKSVRSVAIIENNERYKDNAAIEVPFQQESATALPSNQYRVYKLPYESPIDPGATHAISTRNGDTLSSPDGWHKVANAITYNYTRGNNVWAFQDPSPGPLGGVPSADPTRTSFPTNTTAGIYPIKEPFVFDYPINLNNEPETYMHAAIVNLFYWNNLMHDVFYYMGFNEVSGNFQESNKFSSGAKGGTTALANDAVLAQAQDGGGTNNANFLTLPDGTNGQMQMYLWTAAFPDSIVQVSSSSSGTPRRGAKYISVQGSFNTLPVSNSNLYTNPVVNKQIAIVQKNALSVVGSSSEGCATGQQSLALPANNVSGKIALIDRGSCSFVEKVLGAQLGGAAGAIIINNVDGPPQAMGGSDAPGNAVTIPAVMISKADGAILKAQLSAGATITGSLKRNTPPPPKRDGDIDNGVISHEYGHGISNRLTGGPMALSPLGGDEQGGEGWSDFVALYMTMRKNDLSAANTAHPYGTLPKRSIGNYVTYQKYDGQGIREFPYSTDLSINPATFAYIKRPDYAETHSVGFVWCSMLYELLQSLIDKYGMNDNIYEGGNPTTVRNPASTAKGNNIATRLVIEAMKLQPVSPTFIQERDAILKADTLLYKGRHGCIIWKAFAKRGLGFSASSGTNSLGDETEAFDVPFSCDPSQKRLRIEKTGPIVMTNNTTVTYTIKVTNLVPASISNIKITDTLAASLKYTSSSLTPAVSGKILTWTVNLAKNASTTITVKAALSSTATSTLLFGDDQEANSGKWTTDASTTAKWTYTANAAQAYSGQHFWFVPDYDLGGSNTSLRTKTAVNVPSSKTELIFIHKFAAENDYDGGVVEVSTDGSNWAYLPPSKFVKGGYTGIIPTANNPLIGTSDLAAFSGASAGYIVSIAKLDDYVGKNIFVRFRMTSDPTGGSVTNGGWWLDNVYILNNRTELQNRATAITTSGAKITEKEGTNAYNLTSGFILKTATAAKEIPGAIVVKPFGAKLYPNPANSLTNLSISNPLGSNVYIQLYDVSGKKLATFNAGKANSSNVTLPLQTLKSGTYWVEVQTDKQSQTLQMIVNK